LCNCWRQQQKLRKNAGKKDNSVLITSKQIEAFDALFVRGLMAAARNELCQANNDWPLLYVNMTSSKLISLLIQHGGNPLERDIRGVSLLHWAAGTGNLAAVQVLLPLFSTGVFTEAERDGALPLHWAAAGAKTREFGCGGHPEVCQFLLEQGDVTIPLGEGVASRTIRDTKMALVNAITKDGNSALMWAAWSGTLETVKLLVRNRADPLIRNRNGCTAAHWAASGGNVAVCQYLADICHVDFNTPNYGGNTPLTHAVAFGRVDVVAWLRRKGICDLSDAEGTAMHLAQDFVKWTAGEEKRQKVFNLMADWLGIDEDDNDHVDHNRMNPYQDDTFANVEIY
jgi:ankyrin repeat protein